MHHETMTPEERAHFEAERACPRCCYEPLKRGVNLKDGWWLCANCEIWWQPRPLT